MKLRTQFFLLVGGIIAVPFLVAAFVLLVQYRIDRDRQPLPNYGEISQWIRRQVPLALNHHEYTTLQRDRPPGLDLILVDSTNTVSFSTIPEITPGLPATSGTLLEYIRQNSGSFHFQIDATRNPAASGNALMILKVPRIRPEEQTLRNQFLAIITYSAIALLVFSSFMSFLILRSLNRSILKLEGATRRIAEGDLDFELSAPGNDQISSLTRSFDSMRRALKEEYARRSRFIMGVSHDLRTPLTLIQGYVEAINDGLASEPDSQKRYLSIILDKTRALEAMITDLIEFVRMETGQWRMTHRDVSIQTFLTENARRFAEDAFILKREFGWSIDIPSEAAVRMDAGLFSRALENLVGNAIRYTSPEGKINLNARLEGDHVLMSISDTGIGIPPEDLSRIFDPFYRGTNSRREQGFGLGLTTVKSIIESHGWAIGVSSQLGQGTTFTIRMPLAVATPPAAGAAA